MLQSMFESRPIVKPPDHSDVVNLVYLLDFHNLFSKIAKLEEVLPQLMEAGHLGLFTYIDRIN